MLASPTWGADQDVFGFAWVGRLVVADGGQVMTVVGMTHSTVKAVADSDSGARAWGL